MKYGIIDTTSLDTVFTPGVTRDYRPSEQAMAVALALPAVERSGQPYKRAQFTTGKTALYSAYGFDWAFNGLKARNDGALGYTSGSNKQNHEQGLVNHKPQLIERIGSPTKGAGQYVFLTEAGVARCKAVDAELGKVARGLTLAAYTKAVKAAERAARNAKADAEATADGVYNAADEVSGDEATQVPDSDDNATSEAPTGFDGGEPITADQVEAMQQADADKPEATYEMSGASRERGIDDDDVRAFVALNGNG